MTTENLIKGSMSMKDKLEDLIARSSERESVELAPHVDEPPADAGAWGANDVLSHLAAWRMSAAAHLDAVRTGGPAPEAVGDVDERNATIYEETHDLPAEAVLEAATTSWDALLESVRACSEEDLYKPLVLTPDRPAWQMIANHTYFHLSMHLDWWHSSRDEESEAEDAALWAHDLAIESFPEDSRRGIAEYNLGCFYSLHGRHDEALRLVLLGISLFPGLVEIAKGDPDLDPIRSAPELAAALEAGT